MQFLLVCVGVSQLVVLFALYASYCKLEHRIAKLELEGLKDVGPKHNAGCCEGRAKTFEEARKH